MSSLWNFAVNNVLEQFLDWLYGQAVDFLGQFLAMMNSMGLELFDMDWVKGIISFFVYLGWALYAVGIVVAVFDIVIEMQTGRGSVRDVALNILKGFMAVGLFSMAPIQLYKTSVTLQTVLIGAISGTSSTPDSISALGIALITNLALPGSGILVQLVFIALIGYAIIKVFFANLKRGGILLIMIAVGSLYMFSVPRGYMDGFMGWCKQVIALCVTAFLQTLILVAGLLTFNDSMLLGIGLMLSATEVPRIAGHFGLDTSTRANLSGAVSSAQSAFNLARTVAVMVK
jgi:hypothetical protein